MEKSFDTTILTHSQVQHNVALSEHISFRLGGSARTFVLLDERDAPSALRELRASGVKYAFLGNGTNVLVRDDGFDGVIIKLKSTPPQICGNRVTVSAGTSLAVLAQAAAEHSLTGLEFAHGIPGTLGGAAVMNAGAYGGEMKDVIVETDCVDETGALLTFRGEAQAFSYRHSIFSDKNLIVLGCRLELQPGDESAIRARMAELAEKRRTSQPLDKPSAGSTFKRPEKGYAAALIDEAGLKGYRIGDAAVSEKHAGFVVNLGNATFADVLAVMDHAQKTVFARSGIQLEPEVRIIQQDAGGK